MEWRNVTVNDNYEVSSTGEVRNKTTKRVLKPWKNKYGYYYINLCKEGICKNYKIHRIVALAFLENPDNLPTVDHINQKKDDNNLINLRWASRRTQQLNRGMKSETPNISTTNKIYWRLEIYPHFRKYYRKDKYSIEQVSAIRDAKLAELGLPPVTNQIVP